MSKKRKKQFNVRLKEGTAFAIQELSERWGCSQAEVIERVIAGTLIPPREGTVRMPPMVEGPTHWEIGTTSGKAVLRAEPTEDPTEIKIVPIDEV